MQVEVLVKGKDSSFIIFSISHAKDAKVSD